MDDYREGNKKVDETPTVSATVGGKLLVICMSTDITLRCTKHHYSYTIYIGFHFLHTVRTKLLNEPNCSDCRILFCYQFYFHSLSSFTKCLRCRRTCAFVINRLWSCWSLYTPIPSTAKPLWHSCAPPSKSRLSVLRSRDLNQVFTCLCRGAVGACWEPQELATSKD